MSLTAEEARAIGDGLHEAAKNIDTYLNANFNNINRSDYDFLYESFSTIMRVSVAATTVAVGLVIDGLADPAAKLTNVIMKAKAKIAIMETVGRVIRLVAGLADLAAGIVAKDANGIIAAVKNLDGLIG